MLPSVRQLGAVLGERRINIYQILKRYKFHSHKTTSTKVLIETDFDSRLEFREIINKRVTYNLSLTNLFRHLKTNKGTTFPTIKSIKLKF